MPETHFGETHPRVDDGQILWGLFIRGCCWKKVSMMAHFNAAEAGQVVWDTACVFYYHNSFTILNNVLLFILFLINNKYLVFILHKASLIEFFLFKIQFFRQWRKIWQSILIVQVTLPPSAMLDWLSSFFGGTQYKFLQVKINKRQYCLS